MDAGIDDIELTSEFTGLPTSMIKATDPAVPTMRGRLPRGSAGLIAGELNRHRDDEPVGMRHSAGHSAAGVQHVLSVAELVDSVERQMRYARDAFVDRWLPPPVR